MEGNYALRLIKRADYCALTSLDTGRDVAHVAYSVVYVHVAWSWPVAVAPARPAYAHALARHRATLSRAGPGPGWGRLTTVVCHPLARCVCA